MSRRWCLYERLWSWALFWQGGTGEKKKKRGEACGVKSCITASVHNPWHLMYFSSHSLFNTVRSISRWRKGWRRHETLCSDRHCVLGCRVQLQCTYKRIYLVRRFNVPNVWLLLLSHKRAGWIGIVVVKRVGKIKRWGCDSLVGGSGALKSEANTPRGIWIQKSTFQVALCLRYLCLSLNNTWAAKA